MNREDKIAFIKEMETLCRMSRTLEDLVIEVGYREYCGSINARDAERFIPSTERLEWLCLRWGDQDRRFGRYVPIEGDSCYGILCDAMKVITRMC